jgi:hypothetical protein
MYLLHRVKVEINILHIAKKKINKEGKLERSHIA